MPPVASPWVVLVAVLYLAATVAIGLAAARGTATARDFYVAGRGAGLVPVVLATTSAAFSGFVFVGGPGLTYRLGLASVFIFLPVAFTALLKVEVLARPLRALADTHEVYTVPDAVRARFGSPLAGGIAALAVLLGVVAYLGLQVQALGTVLDAALGITRALGPRGPVLALAAGAALLALYAATGGMKAGLRTETFQAGVMIVAAVAVFVRAITVAGGPAAIARSIAADPRFGERFLHPVGGAPAASALGLFFVFSVGVLGQPHVVHKFLMLSDTGSLRWFGALTGTAQSLCLLLWIGIGLAVPALVAQGAMTPLAHPDDATPRFLLEKAGAPLAGLVLAGTLAAIMSTADALANVGAAALVRDLPRALGRPRRDELRAGRFAVLGLTAAAALFSFGYADLVAVLGTFAFGLFAAALAPVLSVGLAWRRVGGRAAALSIGAGLALHVACEALARHGMLPVAAGTPPAALALAGSYAVLFLSAWLLPAR